MQTYHEVLTRFTGEEDVVAFESCADAPQVMVGLHWHDAYELLYVRRGYGEQMLNGERFSIYPGDLVVICPCDVHATSATAPSGCDIDVVQFYSSFLEREPDARYALQSGALQRISDRVESVMELLARARSESDAGSRLRVRGLVQLLLGILLALERDEQEPACSSVMRVILSYLETANDMSLKSVASMFGYSEEHLSRKFRTENGVSYRAWCERIRMRRALSLLNDEELGISQIAERLGYADDSSFIRAFKRMYGITPRVCRGRKASIGGN